MANLRALANLEIAGFRAFRRLRLEKVSGVNLIVGANNLGKTSLLEAINIYFTEGNRVHITDVLLARDEFSFLRMRQKSLRSREINLAYESLFFGRPQLDSNPSFTIDPLSSNRPKLTISFAWMKEFSEETSEGIVSRTVKVVEADEDAVPGLETIYAQRQQLISLDRYNRDAYYRSRAIRSPEFPVFFLGAGGMPKEELGRLWDSIALTEDEEVVVDTLKMISPSLEKIVLVQSPTERAARTLMAKLERFPDPVPFKSLGEGIQHLLSIVLALVRTRNGILLIDEIENGLHYSVQPDLWRVVFKQAANWGIQVFATTHSWDCVEGFQMAASAQSTPASLYRIESWRDELRAIRFAPKEIEIARKESIEVR